MRTILGTQRAGKTQKTSGVLDHNAEICAATARKRGRNWSRISLRVVRVEWVLG